MIDALFFLLYILSCCASFVIYRIELREDWQRWRKYRKEIRQKGISKEDKERITLVYWLISGKF